MNKPKILNAVSSMQSVTKPSNHEDVPEPIIEREKILCMADVRAELIDMCVSLQAQINIIKRRLTVMEDDMSVTRDFLENPRSASYSLQTHDPTKIDPRFSGNLMCQKCNSYLYKDYSCFYEDCPCGLYKA